MTVTKVIAKIYLHQLPPLSVLVIQFTWCLLCTSSSVGWRLKVKSCSSKNREICFLKAAGKKKQKTNRSGQGISYFMRNSDRDILEGDGKRIVNTHGMIHSHQIYRIVNELKRKKESKMWWCFQSKPFRREQISLSSQTMWIFGIWTWTLLEQCTFSSSESNTNGTSVHTRLKLYW